VKLHSDRRDWRCVWFGHLHVGGWVSGEDLLLGLHNGNVVWQGLLGSSLAIRVPRQHDLYFDSKYSLSEEHVTRSGVNIIVGGLSGVDHQTVDEFHRLGTLSTQFAADHNFATLSSRLHDETEHTVASPPDGKTSDEFVTERLSLGDGAETTGGDLLGVQLNAVFLEVEPLLNDGGQFPDSASLLSEYILRACGHDDDLSASRGDAHLDAGVTILGEFTSQELVQLRLEDSVSYKLPLL